MPSARVRSATSANDGERLSMRAPTVRSWRTSLHQSRRRFAITVFFRIPANSPAMASRSPNASSAARRASSRLMPAASNSRVRSSMCISISRSTSLAALLFLSLGARNTRFMSVLLWTRSREHCRHDTRVIVPPRELGLEMFAAVGREAIELAFAVGLGDAPLLLEEPTLFEPMQHRIEDAVFHEQRAVGGLADPAANRVAVHRPPAHRFEDEEIE